ncbi:HAD-superfamily subfamily IIID h [Basidiobolus meristosporus CBS 931.73]|uniref:HAD-superfamily subfamily IIID h n=1 Tax=Basidiobolus meristosporus CBS 931.73 TaxID=1314790 RepID=A0A1Y1XIB5_9FUNG|nr:HAD-superfamily subfamily IIID h [Basidiobolus meristosporus CBS 931.73]|eukprot:ORX85499.1 HAD-superfamily subfamily IIID h [Basidiobolus meristosporus CBS 931.73]
MTATWKAHLTQVKPKRQKIIGLVKGKLPLDDIVLGSLQLKDNHTFIMMGTPEENILKDPSELDLPEVINDLDYDYIPEDDDTYKNDKENKAKLMETISKAKIPLLNPLRQDKKLLVLDLDYTLFDCKTPANHISELMRPGLHEFMATVYECYDIMIWSQTSWRTLEMKVTELGLLTHPEYKIAAVIDISCMFSITTRRPDGTPFKHQVKALDIIWSKFPDQFSAENTIHIDDLGRNFAMNPASGLKISAFKNGPVSRATDRELYPLAKYLILISEIKDFRKLNHKKWKSYPGVRE